MTMTLAGIFRHPVKSLGEEPLGATALTPGSGLPGDRRWAIAHGSSEWSQQDPRWVPSRNFVTQGRAPALAQIQTAYDDAAGTLRLSHPALPDLSIAPETDAGATALTDWIAPLAGDDLPGPYRVCANPARAFWDFEDTHVSIATTASLRALEALAGRSLETIRFRMNLWLDGAEPWEDLDWVGKDIAIGEARLRITARDARCQATNASPVTGTRDTELPYLLKKTLGHADFGVYATVTTAGPVQLGDTVRVLA